MKERASGFGLQASGQKPEEPEAPDGEEGWLKEEDLP
jgi:hypothetical protein